MEDDTITRTKRRLDTEPTQSAKTKRRVTFVNHASKTAVIYIYVSDVYKDDIYNYNVKGININETIIPAPPDHSDKSEYIIQPSDFSSRFPSETMYFKKYFYDVTQGDMIMLATLDKRINVLTCTKKELLTFLSLTEDPSIDYYFESREICKTYVDTDMIKFLIEIMTVLFKITKINIIERSAEMEDNGFTDRVNYIIRQLPLPYVRESRMSIGFFCHGYIGTEIIPVPDNVEIRKQNVSAYGCITISQFKIGLNAINTAIKSLINVSCVNQEKYLEHSKQLKDENPMFHSEEGTCRLFEGPEPFVKKYYSGGTIVFAMIKDGHFKCLDLYNCSESGFNDFFSVDGSYLHTNNIKIYINVIKKYKKITTTEIFDLIKCANVRLGITAVHIYDKSCNVISAGPDENHVDGYKVDFNPTADVRFGGTKCKRKTKRKRRKTKRSHKN